MSITIATPLPIGDAVRVSFGLPTGTTRTRLLRKTVDSFVGVNDPDAVITWEGDAATCLDTSAENGVDYWYKAYHLVAGTWTPGDGSAHAVAAATYVDTSVDPQTLVRDRLKAALKVEVQRNSLVHEYGYIPVLTAPPVYEDTRWPVVVVHMDAEAVGERFLGEVFGADTQLENGDWMETEGWLADVTLKITGWTLNPDERIELRKALRRIIVGNLSVFDASGILQIEPRWNDLEDFETFPAAVYLTECTFTCKAPVGVSDPASAIDDVIVTPHPISTGAF